MATLRRLTVSGPAFVVGSSLTSRIPWDSNFRQEKVSDIVDQGSFAERESIVAPRQIYTVEDILA